MKMLLPLPVRTKSEASPLILLCVAYSFQTQNSPVLFQLPKAAVAVSQQLTLQPAARAPPDALRSACPVAATVVPKDNSLPQPPEMLQPWQVRAAQPDPGEPRRCFISPALWPLV